MGADGVELLDRLSLAQRHRAERPGRPRPLGKGRSVGRRSPSNAGVGANADPNPWCCGLQSALRQIVQRYGLNFGAATAEDLAQDAALITFRRLGDQPGVAAALIQSFMTRTAHWLAHNLRRKQLGDRSLAAEEPCTESTLDWYARREQVYELARALRQLRSARDRRLLAALAAGASKNELLAEFGLSAAHYDRVLYRARQRLGAVVAENGPSQKQPARSITRTRQRVSRRSRSTSRISGSPASSNSSAER